MMLACRPDHTDSGFFLNTGNRSCDTQGGGFVLQLFANGKVLKDEQRIKGRAVEVPRWGGGASAPADGRLYSFPRSALT
jgi:hypothetical protein